MTHKLALVVHIIGTNPRALLVLGAGIGDELRVVLLLSGRVRHAAHDVLLCLADAVAVELQARVRVAIAAVAKLDGGVCVSALVVEEVFLTRTTVTSLSGR